MIKIILLILSVQLTLYFLLFLLNRDTTLEESVIQKMELENSHSYGGHSYSSVNSGNLGSSKDNNEPYEKIANVELNDFTVKQLIGEGAFGQVHIVQYKQKSKQP